MLRALLVSVSPAVVPLGHITSMVRTPGRTRLTGLVDPLVLVPRDEVEIALAVAPDVPADGVHLLQLGQLVVQVSGRVELLLRSDRPERAVDDGGLVRVTTSVVGLGGQTVKRALSFERHFRKRFRLERFRLETANPRHWRALP